MRAPGIHPRDAILFAGVATVADSGLSIGLQIAHQFPWRYMNLRSFAVTLLMPGAFQAVLAVFFVVLYRSGLCVTVPAVVRPVAVIESVIILIGALRGAYRHAIQAVDSWYGYPAALRPVRWTTDFAVAPVVHLISAVALAIFLFSLTRPVLAARALSGGRKMRLAAALAAIGPALGLYFAVTHTAGPMKISASGTPVYSFSWNWVFSYAMTIASALCMMIVLLTLRPVDSRKRPSPHCEPPPAQFR